MRLTGFEAIEYAEKEGLPLNKREDQWNEAREGLTVAEAEAIATEDESLIYVDVPEDEFQGNRRYDTNRRNIEPQR